MRKIAVILFCLLVFKTYSAVADSHAACALESVSFENVPSDALNFIEINYYEASKIRIENTDFYVLTRLSGGVGKNLICRAIRKAWPRWIQLDLTRYIPKSVTFIDLDQPLGGGPLAKNVLGIYLGEALSGEIQGYITQMLGWKPNSPAQNYITKYYREFIYPMQAYVDDMVVHELGHLFFGFGLTSMPNDKDLWFSLGLGLVYDRKIWSQLASHSSPLFKSTVSIWKKKFSRRVDIDQRLVNPDISKDKSAGLVRDHTYGHGKAFVFLSKLREKLGKSSFDRLVKRYLAREVGSPISYNDFLSYLPAEDLEKVKQLEEAFLVR